MATLLSLPTELISEILGSLRPITALHEQDLLEEHRWDIRHWGRTLAAVARTCRFLRDVAVPLLHTRYEATFRTPIIQFIDGSTAKTTLHNRLRHVTIRGEDPSDSKYVPTQERRLQYCAWTKQSEFKSCRFKQTRDFTVEQSGQLELWRLISRAPNLETLDVTNVPWLEDSGRTFGPPPVWLLPIVSAAQNLPKEPKYSGWFQKLHSLNLNLQGKSGLWLFQLFSLPCLQLLCLKNMKRQPYKDWTKILTWPEATATSSVQHLSLMDVGVPADMIVRMIGCCKTLKSFKCWRSSINSLESDGRARLWGTAILDGLQRHKHTLVSLDLNPYDRYQSRQLALEYERLQGFQTLVALEVLNAPWHILMGCPAGTANEPDYWDPVIEWQYPAMRDVLPGNLQSLNTSISDICESGCQGIEAALCSALPPENWEDDVLLLKDVHLIYDRAHYYNPLPANFWRVQNAFHKAGCAFTYKIILDSFDFMWVNPAQGHEDSFSTLAETLANEGPPGVHMALRSEVKTLPKRVMNILGLGKDWLDSAEAKEILFGEQVDYDAIDYWQLPRRDKPDEPNPDGQDQRA